MTKTAEKIVATPVALTDDVAGMADYGRSPEGRAAIERGVADIQEGRTIEGKDALASELKRRAAIRRPLNSAACAASSMPPVSRTMRTE